jgi:hypothetical protein
MDKPLERDNLGYKLILKMGWKEGGGLGREATGIVEPIRLSTTFGFLGIGKVAEIDEWTNSDNISRKLLTVEAIENETDEERAQRLALAKCVLASCVGVGCA